MFEYSSVSASTYDMASLVARINERAAEGWRVVSVVTAGADAVALLEREGTGSPVVAAAAAASVAEPVAAVAPAAAEPVQEPAGWALEPTATAAVTAATSSAASAWGDTAASTPVQAVVEPVQAVVQQPVQAVVEPVQAVVQQAPVTPAVPAGWYPDPSGRFEQRYWDGTQWTEHVARQGQQYTDPPVA
jgi:hypothetical protein